MYVFIVWTAAETDVLGFCSSAPVACWNASDQMGRLDVPGHSVA
jgi:hypothetical protein